MTTRQIKAHFLGGVFVPDEAIELEDGCEAQIFVDDLVAAEDAGFGATTSHPGDRRRNP